MNYCLGVDIGGTKTAIAIADANCVPIVKTNFPTNPQFGAENLVERINACFTDLCNEKGISREQVTFCGVACPGPLNVKQGKIVHIATMGFKDVPIRLMLENALGIKVYLENDANCAALAEYSMGVASGADPLVYITVSTGVGCGIISEGRILSGALSSAGEIGHLTVNPNGKECPCGKKGCLEMYSSGTAIATAATDLRGTVTDTKTVFSLAREGDQKMKKIIDDAADKLGLAMSSVYHIIDPQVIVLGGSVTKDYVDIAAPLNSALKKYTQPIKDREFNIKISDFDGEQVLIGALLYAKQSIVKTKDE